jgi:transcriptional regulator with XRE-family HTH domain
MSLLHGFKTAAEVQADIAAAARERRLAMNLTQTELSARSGVPIATLKRFEAGGAASLATVLAVAEALEALEGFVGGLKPRKRDAVVEAVDAALADWPRLAERHDVPRPLARRIGSGNAAAPLWA